MWHQVAAKLPPIGRSLESHPPADLASAPAPPRCPDAHSLISCASMRVLSSFAVQTAAQFNSYCYFYPCDSQFPTPSPLSPCPCKIATPRHVLHPTSARNVVAWSKRCKDSQMATKQPSQATKNAKKKNQNQNQSRKYALTTKGQIRKNGFAPKKRDRESINKFPYGRGILLRI
ncbi:uncharacterized protein K452DRAFT_62086 [Aplosporella prunicola CBS 121167]|uniref:60S ribosomal protein L29 n=1 Tax=Aplosporella prunicola CBS 121167 TaxID=1176127 RepID=A0A6A6B859_9PEZI|nr:uncharacterized protein K452DRAFT_62086 [Aplosporella prunicola CBS 121167]KAF2139543.1 hypothetical protein K452DRAFT_62086 [Aplosporella prunicola CBS 121167]